MDSGGGSPHEGQRMYLPNKRTDSGDEGEGPNIASSKYLENAR